MVTRALTSVLLAVLRGYKRFVSPFFTGVCRFSPSCSTYATDALTRYGPWRGSWMAVRRLARCHPFAKSGFDPVPGSADRPPPGQALR